MLYFKLLEIRRNIEEGRIFYGKKLEIFLIKKALRLKSFINKQISQKSTAFFGTFFIILSSIFISSNRYLGPDSSAYFLGLKKDASPLFLKIIFAINFLANHFSIHAEIIATFLANLSGIILLIIFYKNLSKSEIAKNQAIFNLTIFAVAIGFFLRVFTLDFNEFFTTSTCLLFLALSYFSYQLLDQKSLQKFDFLAINFISFLLISFDLKYLFLIVIFEIFNLAKSRDFTNLALKNIAAIYAIFGNFFYYEKDIFDKEIFYQISQFDVAPIVILMLIFRSFLQKNPFLTKFYLLNLAAILIALSSPSLAYDKRFIIFSLSVPSLILLAYFLLKERKILWVKDWVILFLLIFLPNFALENFSKFFADLIIFWWVFVLWHNFSWHKIDAKNQKINQEFFANFFWLRNIKSIFCFGILSLISIRFIANYNVDFLIWLCCLILFFCFVSFSEKVHKISFNDKNFSRFKARIVIFLFGYLSALHFDAIFANENFSNAALRNPNFISNQINQTIIKSNSLNSEITFISSDFSDYSSLFFHLGKNNNFNDLESLKLRLKNKENKLIFVEDDECRIGFIEEYSRDKEFAKIFSQNYTFLNRIFESSEKKVEAHFFSDKELEYYEKALGQNIEKISRDIDVYIRK